MTEGAYGEKRVGEIAFVTAGDPMRVTGGYLYNRRILAALCTVDMPVTQVVLPERQTARSADVLRTALARQKPAVVIVDSIALSSTAPLSGWIRESLGSRLLALMHMLPSDLAQRGQRPLVRNLEASLLAAADRVVAVSPNLRERLIAAGSAPACTEVVMPGRDGIPLPPAIPGDRSGHRFLCVANWSPNKGIHLLVEAMARIGASWELDLVGEAGKDAYSRRVRGLIDRYGLSGRVRIRGALEGDDLVRSYAAADVFVLPSQSEGFGMVYAEAMSFGLPVIACHVGPLPWLVEEGCGLLVPPADRFALTEAMEKLAFDSQLRRQTGEAAFSRAQQLPTWQESTQRFCDVVRDLLERR